MNDFRSLASSTACYTPLYVDCSIEYALPDYLSRLTGKYPERTLVLAHQEEEKETFRAGEAELEEEDCWITFNDWDDLLYCTPVDLSAEDVPLNRDVDNAIDSGWTLNLGWDDRLHCDNINMAELRDDDIWTLQSGVTDQKDSNPPVCDSGLQSLIDSCDFASMSWSSVDLHEFSEFIDSSILSPLCPVEEQILNNHS